MKFSNFATHHRMVFNSLIVSNHTNNYPCTSASEISSLAPSKCTDAAKLYKISATHIVYSFFTESKQHYRLPKSVNDLMINGSHARSHILTLRKISLLTVAIELDCCFKLLFWALRSLASYCKTKGIILINSLIIYISS